MSTYAVKWVPAVHYTKGRERPVRRIVLHWMATNLAGCDATFTAGQREASAHYGLEDDQRHQYVKETDTAWHAGNRTINHESIGIEHSAQPGRDATAATIANSVDLCTDLCRRYGLTADAIDQHSDFYATQCPGTLPVSRIREAVRANLANPTPAQEDDMPSVDDVWNHAELNPVTGKPAQVGDMLRTAMKDAYYARQLAGQTLGIVKALAAKPQGLTAAEVEAAAKSGAAAALEDKITDATVNLNVKGA